MKQPPKEQDVENDDCPICGLPLKYPALSRFDNETYVCGHCGQAEGTGFLFAFSLVDGMRDMLQEWTGSLVGRDEFETKQPQLTPRHVVADPQALRNPRPDRTEPQTVPVGPGGFPDRGIALRAFVSVGQVTVTT